ncbi:MAG: GNAT family N-acetyltransferase [Bacillota bacterium]
MTNMRKCTFNEVHKIHDLMTYIDDIIRDDSIFDLDDIEFVKRHIKATGFTVGVFDNERLIAFLIVRIPNKEKDNLGYNLEIKELDKVIHMESLGVHPDYRGKGLQKKMIRYAEKLLEEGKYKYLTCTVSPKNTHSLKNFQALGYEIELKAKKYDGYQRYILKKIVKNK